MKAQTEPLTTETDTFAWAEEQLRMLQLEAEKIAEAGVEAEALHEECVRLCEELLSWRDKVRAAEKEAATVAVEREERCLGPSDRRLHEMRRELSRKYENEVPQELRHWISTWNVRVEGAVLEKSLQWIRHASLEVEVWERLWTGTLSGYRGLTLWGRFRAFRLAKRARASEARMEELGREVMRTRSRVGQILAETKLLAGMVSVFLKLHAGEGEPENRIVNRVLELDRERELERLLEKAMTESRAAMRQTAEQGRSIEQSTRDRRREHGKLEQRKNVRMLEAWTDGKCDPRKLIAEATETQIVAAWSEVERRIEGERAAVREVQRQERRLEDEFERLMGVVREYEEATQAEKGRGDAAGGVSQTAAGTTRRSAEGIRH